MSKKGKTKKQSNYYRYKESKLTPFQSELYSYISRVIKAILLMTGASLLWYLLFIYYPQTTMVDIKGIVEEKQFRLISSRSGPGSRYYTIKLNNYATPLELHLAHGNKINFNMIQEGKEVTVQVQRKDLDRIINSDEQKTSCFLFNSDPRMYGITANERVIITSEKALWNFSGPYIPYVISIFVVLFVIFFGMIFLYYDLKHLFVLIWNKLTKQ